MSSASFRSVSCVFSQTRRHLPRVRVYGILAVLVATACPGIERAGAVPVSGVREAFAGDTIIVIAHRGCWQPAPENSLAAIEACIELGVDMVELDVRQTRDGALVAIHDETLDRTTDRAGFVGSATLSEIRHTRLRAGAGGQGTRLTSERLPTLREALQLAKDRVLVNLDVKEPIHDAVMAVVDQLGVADQVLFKLRAAPDSPDLAAADFHGRAPFMPILAQCNPAVPTGEYCIRSLAGIETAYGAYAPVAYELVFHDDRFLQEALVPLRRGGAEIWVNTLYPEIAGGRDEHDPDSLRDAIWGSLIDMGVTAIQTDRPAYLLDYLAARGQR